MRARRASTAVWPAPVKGLIRNGTVVGADPSSAEVLTNFIPTAQSARLRGGSRLFATAGAAVVRMMIYRSGAAENMFAATAADIFDISAPVDPNTPPAAVVTSLTSGDWSFVQFATPGGQFLVIANGADTVRNYNGTAWSVPAITGVTSSLLSFVWSHKKSLWFVEKNQLSAWYLPVNSIAGAAAEFPLDGVFKLGGSLIFGGTWSLDAGDGLDDMMLFITSEGEIAVYQGTNPATDFALTGVYRIGKPLNKHSWFRAGGDLCIITRDGIVPVSEAVRKDVAALQTAAITFPIEDLWQSAIANATTASAFPAIVWPTQTIFIVGVPSASGQYQALVANTRTGAWATITGWDIQCMAVFGDNLYFGNAAGQVLQADTGGKDAGANPAYTGYYVPKFQDFGSPDDKIALHARALWVSDGSDQVLLGCFQNYTVGTFSTSAPAVAEVGNKWGTVGLKWGTVGLKWGASVASISASNWQAVSGMGFSLAPSLVVSSNRATKPQFELSAVHLRYETGRAI